MQYAPTTQIVIDMGELCHERSDMRVTRGVPDSHDRETHRARARRSDPQRRRAAAVDCVSDHEADIVARVPLPGRPSRLTVAAMQQPLHYPALPTAADVDAAAQRLAGIALRTPLVTSPVLDALTGARIFLKAETLQRTGSFKFRGAYNKALIDPAGGARRRRAWRSPLATTPRASPRRRACSACRR